MLAKIVDGNLKYAPNTLTVGDRLIINPPEKVLREQGWLLYESGEYPPEEEGFYWKPVYEVNTDNIIRKFKKVKSQSQEIDRITVLEAQVAYTAMMTNTLSEV